MANDLFSQLAGIRSIKIPVVLQPGIRIRLQEGGKDHTLPAPNTEPLQFHITPLTANQMVEADAILNDAKPPQVFEKVSRPGTVDSLVGYDYDAPGYINERDRLIPKRNAMICLMGCEDLMKTTPGANVMEKIDALLSQIPGVIVQWLSGELENQAMLAGVGDEEVSAFFSEGSDASQNSKSSSGRSRARKKARSSTGSTGPTSPTKNGKPPATGE